MARTRLLSRLIASVLAGFVSAGIGAADGDLDPTFGNGGKVTTSLGFPAQSGHAVALYPDGRIVVAGWTFDNSANIDFGVVRYQPSGVLDKTFGTAGTARVDFFGLLDTAYAVAIQPDGKVVLAGIAGLPSKSHFALARYDVSGHLDPSFGEDGLVTTDVFGPTGGGSLAQAAALQPDGKIVVAGSALVRYNPDGTLDSRFGDGGRVVLPTEAAAVAVQRDGKIVVVGQIVRDGSPTGDDWLLLRYRPNGSPDSQFGSSGSVQTDFFGRYDRPFALALQPDDKIVAAGSAQLDSNEGPSFAVARYEIDGRLDASFDGDGRRARDLPGFSEDAFAVAVQGDGKVLLGGISANPDFTYDFTLLRLNRDGSDDPGFGNQGLVRTDFFGGSDGLNGLAIQPDGRIVAAGGASFGGLFAVARYQSTIEGNEESDACARPAGYWMKHPELWPVISLILGAESYDRDELLRILSLAIKGDASRILARDLIAGKLNVARGVDSLELSTTIARADALLAEFEGTLPYNVPPASSNGGEMIRLASELGRASNPSACR